MADVGHHADPAVRALQWRHDQWVVGTEDRQLLLRKAGCIVRGAERHEPANERTATGLRQVARDEATQAVPDEVHVGGPRRTADAFDCAPELVREALVVEARPVREAREVADAAG